jgi:hypothetical protein
MSNRTRCLRWRGASQRALLLVALWYLGGWPLAVQAQAAQPVSASEPSAQPAEYGPAVEVAFDEFRLGNYPEARARFLDAHQLYPNARTHRALGMVEYELKNYGDAIEQLRLALSSRVKPLEGQLRADTEALLLQAEGYVARVNVEIKPERATVVVDGVPMEIAPGETILLQVGDHNLEFRAPGRVPEKRVVKVHGGEQTSIRVVLAPEVNADGKVEARPLRKNPWLWTAMGVAVAGAALSTVIALQAEPKEHRLNGSPEINGGIVQTLWVAP